MSSNWIWTGRVRPEDREEVVMVLFRREILLRQEAGEARLSISADSRYRLYVNGVMAEMGPSRGDREVWFVDEVDLTPYLRPGRNVLAVRVLHYPTIDARGNHGIWRTEYPGLYVCGSVQSGQECISLDADSGWRARRDEGYRIVSEAEDFAPLQIYEDRVGLPWQQGWMSPDYDDSDWEEARVYPQMRTSISPGNLLPRTIPYLYRTERRFEQVLRAGTTQREQMDAAHPVRPHRMADWQRWLQGGGRLELPAHSRTVLEVSAGEEMTGYLHLALEGGAAAGITLVQAEAYLQTDAATGAPCKADRSDWADGQLQGYSDHYVCSGYGEEDAPEIYEPFWFRTFRYIRLEIVTQEEPIVLADLHYTETGYPLAVRTAVRTSDPSMEQIREISERTLRRCMHETYEDCPYYEQLQYAMDARSEILYTYAVSADDRLARKCMDDFRRSQRYDGLLNASYPCYGSNVIPGFSIYYILMLHDHMMYFDDRELLEDHLPTVERILLFYHRHRTAEGYVDRIGGLNGRDRFWSFIDWTQEWRETTGVPDAVLQGPVTMESLLYILGLEAAAEMADHLGEESAATRYRERCEDVRTAVRRYCLGGNGMVQDGPGLERYSQHAQVFGVLAGVLDVAQGRTNLLETIRHPEAYAQCSVAMAFYLFRALEATGLYEETARYWDLWRGMLDQHLTTCVEDPVSQRSDCHAWGALALYELPSAILGVRPAAPGYSQVYIHPQTAWLSSAQGEIITPRGEICVQWKKENDRVIVTYRVPGEMRVRNYETALYNHDLSAESEGGYRKGCCILGGSGNRELCVEFVSGGAGPAV